MLTMHVHSLRLARYMCDANHARSLLKISKEFGHADYECS